MSNFNKINIVMKFICKDLDIVNLWIPVSVWYVKLEYAYGLPGIWIVNPVFEWGSFRQFRQSTNKGAKNLIKTRVYKRGGPMSNFIQTKLVCKKIILPTMPLTNYMYVLNICDDHFMSLGDRLDWVNYFYFCS